MANVNVSHPSPDQLAAFGSGRMAELEAAVIEAHVSDCQACISTLDALPKDTLDSLLKKPAPLDDSRSADAAPAHVQTPRPAVATTCTYPTLPGPAPGVLPEQFGRYRILKELGKGGMGSVYLAHDTKLNRQVALKVPSILPDDNPAILERFRREAQAMGEFRHPNLCPIYDVDELNGIHFYTMPYIAGISLHDWIQKKGLPGQKQVAGLIRKLALALLEAHKRGVIHRDLKPGNIMIEKTARNTHEPIIVDFGLARREKADDLRLTRTGAAMGTPAYMPPEQLRGQPDKIGPNCDIYSLGATMYELLTGRLPFTNSNWAELTDDILHKPPPHPSSFRPDVDPRLAAICLKCLEKDIKDRYASMKELAEELATYLNTAAPAAKRQHKNTIEDVFAEIAGDGPRPDRETVAAGWKGRLPKWAWLAVAGGAAALVFLIGIVIIIETKDGKIRIETTDTDATIIVQQSTGAGTTAATKADKPKNTHDAGPTAFTEDKDGWVQLFNGNDLTGWYKPTQYAGTWDVRNGVLIGKAKGGGQPAFLATTRNDLADYRLRLEIADWETNTHMLLRGNVQGGTTNGYRVMLFRGGTGGLGVGSMGKDVAVKTAFGTLEYVALARDTPIEPGAPYTLEAVVKGNRISTYVNSEFVAEYADAANSFASGRIVLICRGGSSLRFRKIEIQELSPPKEPAKPESPVPAKPEATPPKP